MLRDYSMSQVTNANQCLDKCNSDRSCEFWDYGGGKCRLRKNSGSGPKVAYGYSYGPKNCIFGSSSGHSGIQNGSIE